MPTETHVHFNKQYLEEEIRQLASLQQATLDTKTLQPIGPILTDAKETLTQIYRVLAKAAKQNRELSSAGEWLIDNFYIIQEQIVQLKEDLPSSYYKKLPRLTQGEYIGYPRTYEIVQLLAAFSDNIIDQGNTTTAIRAFQEVDTLNLAEMWSIPLMHRLTLLVRLSQRSKRLLRDRRIQDEIEQILDEQIDQQSDEPGYLLRKLSEIVDPKYDTNHFLIVLAQQLQKRGMLTEGERRWFDYKFARSDTTLEEQLRNRNQQTSRLHLSIQNAISSLRVVSETDWSKLIESCSVVERILRLDPADMYSRMDFSTRDSYRKKVELLSSRTAYSEQEVAEQALLMAESAAQNGTANKSKKMHIGYYLQDDGYLQLAAKLGYRRPPKEWLLDQAENYPSIYFSLISIHFVILILVVAFFTDFLIREWWMISLTLFVSLFPALELSIVSTNRLLSFFVGPRILPKLEFKENIPHEYRTVVIVPTMFSSVADVRHQFEALEIRALASANWSIQFILLSDFHDAPTETLDKDASIIEEANFQVNRLNLKYSSRYGDKFLFFHRKRLWNSSQDCWMGWERKRGKIEEFNRLLCNPAATTTYEETNKAFLDSVQKFPVSFVITLDADTQLPPGSARKLIGTAAHPLNRAEIDETDSVVTKGYGIFQPRISIPPKSANKTWFANIFSGNVGLDPYTTAVSDIYQDLFGEGIFTGKGLYDLQVFEKLLGDRFPDNTVLSHDLLESTYLRTALLTDIELFDDYPTTYLSYSKRNHRWIRGDWQIMSWLFRTVPAKDSKKQKNPISILSKWKIFDNLRRSLTPAALILFLLAGWTLLPGSAIIWTLAVFGIIAFPIYSSFSTHIFQRPERVGWQLYLDKIKADLRMNTIQSVTSFLVLPHQAYLGIDAIVRTLYRMVIARKKLLEWTTAAQTDRQHAKESFTTYWKRMSFNLFWGVACMGATLIWNPSFLAVAIPICLGWIATPPIAFYLGRAPASSKQKTLKANDRSELRSYARRTWHFFDQYVTEDHYWLPPDNVQEDPYIGAIPRTSPTNIGLSLVAACTAYRLGYITFSDMITRLEHTLKAMDDLERFQGHFYNWYSTKTKEVLHPRYLSTVDSGNLAASLIVVQQVLAHIPDQQWPNPAFWNGFEDTLAVITELLTELHNKTSKQTILNSIAQEVDQIQLSIKNIKQPMTLAEWKKQLLELHKRVREFNNVNIITLGNGIDEDALSELSEWLSRPLEQITQQLKELECYRDSKREWQQNTDGAKDAHSISIKYIPAFAKEMQTAETLSQLCQRFIDEMDFGIVYNKERELFSIGYNADRASQDKSFYDLLASEARLASFIAIAKGEIPPEHWFQLSRRLTSIDQNEILLSWGGTMFEYLMPLLFMSRFEKTLLSNTYSNVVKWQRDYGSLRNRPWGFSESGYSILNIDLHYQYRAFGVPGLGLRRGLAEDYVVAPYAGMLALMVDPRESLKNLRTLRAEGAYGNSGFYEAIDYSSNRTNGNNGEDKSIVKMYMAHHQGMSLLALTNILHEHWIQKMFHRHPLVQACELLLQERIPRGIPIKEPRPIDVELEPAEKDKVRDTIDHASIEDLDNTPPRTHILSNGRYSTMLTHSGTGYSVFNDMMLTRWRSDVVTDRHGLFIYVRDLENGDYWSVGHQPVTRKADRYDSWFHAGKVQIARVDNWIESFMEVCVSPEDDIELRKITLTNYSNRNRTIELTSYAEVVLNEQQADASHTAFSNLFVQTEYVQEHHSLLAKRRPRKKDEDSKWLVHTIASEDFEDTGNALQAETDREKFIGRNRSLANPKALTDEQQMSGTFGNVKDPIVSLRRIVRLNPGEKKDITFGLGRAATREDAVDMADRYDNPYATDRVFELASIYGTVELEHIGLSSEQAHYFQKLAGSLLFNTESLRADSDILKRNKKTQAGLWSHSISGDVPILVYHISNTKFIKEVGLLLKAHSFWRQKGIKVDLVFINDHPPSYIDELQESIHQQIQLSAERQTFREKGGIFVLRSDELSSEDLCLIDSVAHAVLSEKLPTVTPPKEKLSTEPLANKTIYHPVDITTFTNGDDIDNSDLHFFNGYGGFVPSGKEYVIRINRDPDSKQLVYPPAPWINVISNEEFGFIATEKGSGYSWSQNSRENKLTPWSNDAVLDRAGEAIYIRDEEEQLFWSPQPGPVPSSSFYEIRHGFGYTSYHSEAFNIEQHLTTWVDSDEPIKFIRLSLHNHDLMSKRLSIFRYLDWVLGVFREETTRHIITEFDSDLQCIFARNFYNNEFAGRVAFAGCFTSNDFEMDSYTGDRHSFIGRNRSLKNPRALAQDKQLDQRFGIGFESCAASQLIVNLASGQSADICFFLGETTTDKQAREVVSRFRSEKAITQSLTDVRKFWDTKLQRIAIHTPVPELNYLTNGWLQYQNIGCRMWARTGFYQAGGAYGFRDQLQDATAACYIDPQLTRKQILLHAGHQFSEGDVLHWWHPPTDRGIRSRITDDLLWLPYVTAFYIQQTGDHSILEEQIPFLSARQLFDGEHEAYLQPEQSPERASLYEHCCRSIDRSLTKGPHGLPLMGSGDWNDGMDKVGIEGMGESVWLGFFIYDIVKAFIPISKKQGDQERVETYTTYQKELKKHLNKEGWDGQWYRRGFYDDGTPLGSSENDECKIDAIAQAWSVISGAGTPEKTRKALTAADQHLVSKEERIIRLLTPAFDKTDQYPGYIKGYIPGVRENGGQYTHAALWLTKAFAEKGHREYAAQLMRMLSPVNHAASAADVHKYQVEPYAVAADIYGEAPLTGMGGWTWYTGSAGWMYRVIIESILGLAIKRGDTLIIDPFISAEWSRYKVSIQPFDDQTTYRVEVSNPQKLADGTPHATLDDKEIAIKQGLVQCRMHADQQQHSLQITIT